MRAAKNHPPSLSRLAKRPRDRAPPASRDLQQAESIHETPGLNSLQARNILSNHSSAAPSPRGRSGENGGETGVSIPLRRRRRVAEKPSDVCARSPRRPPLNGGESGHLVARQKAYTTPPARITGSPWLLEDRASSSTRLNTRARPASGPAELSRRGEGRQMLRKKAPHS